MLPLLGSSLKIRFTKIATCLSVNHPLGLNHVLVATAEAGIIKKDAKPIANVMIPSIINSHLHPAMPCRPCMWKMPNAAKDMMIPVVLSVVQKNERRIGSSLLV
jgi:hypothetical protein